MKKIGFIVLASIAMLFVGCRSSKGSVANNGIVIDSLRSVQMQAEAPGRRAWGGSMSSINKQMALLSAQTDARANLAFMIQTAVDSAMSKLPSKVEDVQTIRTNNFSLEQYITNVRVIHADIYMDKSGIYNVYVCVEILNSIEEMAEQITSSINKQMSEEEKLKKQFDSQEFKKKLVEQLQNMKPQQPKSYY
ncbi:MAG: hypothetical protein IKT86_05545 [Bacteroidaceae bacterium]|nr:hypothetical protein [Bacteroidaceae bacterium]